MAPPPELGSFISSSFFFRDLSENLIQAVPRRTFRGATELKNLCVDPRARVLRSSCHPQKSSLVSFALTCRFFSSCLSFLRVEGGMIGQEKLHVNSVCLQSAGQKPHQLHRGGSLPCSAHPRSPVRVRRLRLCRSFVSPLTPPPPPSVQDAEQQQHQQHPRLQLQPHAQAPHLVSGLPAGAPTQTPAHASSRSAVLTSRLHSNSLRCDCHLAWLSPWLRQRASLGLYAQCSSPPALRGLNLAELRKSDLACSGEAPPPPGVLAALRLAAADCLMPSGHGGSAFVQPCSLASGSCPPMCSCSNNIVDCRGRGLTAIPAHLPEAMTEM